MNRRGEGKNQESEQKVTKQDFIEEGRILQKDEL